MIPSQRSHPHPRPVLRENSQGSSTVRLPTFPQEALKPGSLVKLQIVKSPPTRNLVFIDPWDYAVQVPPYENESKNYVAVVVAEKAHRALLEEPAALRAMAARIIANPALIRFFDELLGDLEVLNREGLKHLRFLREKR